MTCLVFYLLLFGVVYPQVYSEPQEQPPNIVVILADDMGSYDVSYHGSSQFTTSNIDALGYNGIILKRHYTEAICTPSRAALLTGQYPIKLGMQGVPISAGEDRHLPAGVQTLPQLLKELGYSTHLVGKWHLGTARRSDTPTQRGFDTHYGYWNGYVGYFDYEVDSSPSPSTQEIYRGFDLKEKFTDAWKDQGKYATDLFTEKTLEIIENQNKNTPMFLMVTHLAVHTGTNESVEVRDEKAMNDTFGYIEDMERRRYADALNRLDHSVGQIVDKLQQRDMLNNSVVVFMSDNGAQVVGMFHNGGSNYPLRGEKFSLHEGGVRNAAVLYSPLLKEKNYVHDEIIHITDWMPTLYTLAGGNASSLRDIDGVDQWQTISQKKPSNKEEILVNIDETVPYSAIIGYKGRYKLMNGTLASGFFDNYGPEPKTSSTIDYNTTAVLTSLVNIAITQSNPKAKSLDVNIVQNLRDSASGLKNNVKCTDLEKRKNPKTCSDFCLFDLKEDPCETENLIQDESKNDIIQKLKDRLGQFWKEVIPQTNKPVDVNSNPTKYNGTWCTWLDDNVCVKTR